MSDKPSDTPSNEFTMSKFISSSAMYDAMRERIAELERRVGVLHDLLSRFGVWAPVECQDEINAALKDSAPK